jgi:hypothetical protein
MTTRSQLAFTASEAPPEEHDNEMLDSYRENRVQGRRKGNRNEIGVSEESVSERPSIVINQKGQEGGTCCDSVCVMF